MKKNNKTLNTLYWALAIGTLIVGLISVSGLSGLSFIFFVIFFYMAHKSYKAKANNQAKYPDHWSEISLSLQRTKEVKGILFTSNQAVLGGNFSENGIEATGTKKIPYEIFSSSTASYLSSKSGNYQMMKYITSGVLPDLMFEPDLLRKLYCGDNKEISDKMLPPGNFAALETEHQIRSASNNSTDN